MPSLPASESKACRPRSTSGPEERELGYTDNLLRVYKAVANRTANYRDDLRTAAVQRASAIRRSQRPVKDLPAPAPRGKKAKIAAAKAATEEA